MRAICSLRARWARRLGLWERGGGAVGAHVVCAFAPLSALVGSHQLGNWASGKICEQIPPPQFCKIDFTTPSHGASAHTYTQGGQARPTRGLIYATSDLAKPTQRERLSLSPPQQRSLAPIVNGLLTVDVKWLFFAAGFSVCHPRCFVLHSAVAGIWNGITRDAIQSN